MIIRLFWRIISTVSLNCLWKMIVTLCFKGIITIQRFEKERRRSSQFFPAFTMISLTSRCNYTCHGCWVSAKEDISLPLSTVQNIISSSKKHGSYFFGLLGGEPLLYPDLYEILRKNQDCYFQVFTNGAFITKEAVQEFRKSGNVTPVISIEGLKEVSEKRRGGKNVYIAATEALKYCVQAGLFTGVATSICKSNFKDLVNGDFLKNIIEMGAHYVWYYIYRPVGSSPCPEERLTKEQILELRKFIVNARQEFPIIIVDTYWDEKGRALCPGAMGLSHHVSPLGYLEFCPPLQFAKERLTDGNDFAEKVINSHFLEKLRNKISKKTRGCIFMEDPKVLYDWMLEFNAIDSSGRETVYEEFSKMCSCVSHHIPGDEIPEKSLLYKIAKKYWFFGFGAYG